MNLQQYIYWYHSIEVRSAINPKHQQWAIMQIMHCMNLLELMSPLTSNCAHKLLWTISIHVAHKYSPKGLLAITAKGWSIIQQGGWWAAQSLLSRSLEAWEACGSVMMAVTWNHTGWAGTRIGICSCPTDTDQRGPEPCDFLSAEDFCVLGEEVRFTSNVFNKRKLW